MKKTRDLRYQLNISWMALLVATTILASTLLTQHPGLVTLQASAPSSSGEYQQVWYTSWDTYESVTYNKLGFTSYGTNLFVAGTVVDPAPSYADVFVARYNSNGSQTMYFQWQTNNTEYARCIAVSSAGIFVGGYIEQGNEKMLVLKFDVNGNYLWNRTWINSTYSSVHAEDIKLNGTSVFACGWCNSAAKAQDGVLVKYNSDGSQAWNATWGGSQTDEFLGMMIDGKIIRVVGFTDSFGAGNDDLILVNYDANGHFLNQTIWGTTASEGANAIIKVNGYLYLAGHQFITPFAKQALLLKLTQGGTQVWNMTWGSLNWDEAIGMTSNGTHIYLTGYAGFSGGNAGYQAMFLEYDQSGSLLAYKSWGSINNVDISEGIVVMGNSVYAAGFNDTRVFITKFVTSNVPASNLLSSWSREWGGQYMDIFNGISATGDNVYAVGFTETNPGYDQVAICRYNTNGNFVGNFTWDTSTGYQEAYKVASTASNVYVAAVWQDLAGTAQRLVLLKLGSNLAFDWNRTWSPANAYNLKVESIAVNGSDIFVAGSYRTLAMSLSNWDAFLVKFYDNGTKAWNVTWSTPKEEHFVDVAINGGLVWVAGYSKGIAEGDFIGAILCYDASGTFINQTSWGSHTAASLRDATMIGKNFFMLGTVLTNESQEDIFVSKIDQNGTEVWITTWGSKDYETPGGITTNGTHLLVDGAQRLNGSRVDGFFLDIDMNGNLLGTRTWQVGPDGDYMLGIACTGGRVYMAGDTDPAMTQAWIVKIAPYSKPTITSPSDYQYLVGSTGNLITWNVTDDTTLNPWYQVYRNGTLIVSNSTWTSGVAVDVNVDGLDVGVHGFTIVAHDGYGGTISDNVIITVYAANANADLSWVAWIIVICAIAGAIVVLYVLDKKGIIHLKPFWQKTRSVAARALEKTRDGIKSIGGKKASSTLSEPSASNTVVAEQETKNPEPQVAPETPPEAAETEEIIEPQQQAELVNQPEEVPEPALIKPAKKSAKAAAKNAAKKVPAQPDTEESQAIDSSAPAPIKPAKKAAKRAAKKPAKSAAKKT